jgi:membrane protein YdbS with pleckstrin-like domain
MKERATPSFVDHPRRRLSDAIISLLRHNSIVIALYVWVTETAIPLVIAVIIVVPVGTVMLLFYLPNIYRNWHRRRRYGVERLVTTTSLYETPSITP